MLVNFRGVSVRGRSLRLRRYSESFINSNKIFHNEVSAWCAYVDITRGDEPTPSKIHCEQSSLSCTILIITLTTDLIQSNTFLIIDLISNLILDPISNLIHFE